MGPRLSIAIEEKRYRGSDIPVFADFSLTIEPSSIVALVGPSGIGKSTLLRMIAGIDNRYRGSIAVDGRAARDAAPAGFVFQDARLLPWLTALRNITAVRPGISDERAASLLRSVGLAGSEAAYPNQLSGGMQRRLALARAASVNDRFWLFDEPFVSLDRQLVTELQGQFLELAATHAPTVVFVTHQPEEAARLATRAVVLQGRPARISADLAFEGDPLRRSVEMQQRLTAILASAAEGRALSPAAGA